MKQLYGERGRDREDEGKEKSFGERLSVLQGDVCVHMHVPAHAHRQAYPDITIKTK